MNIRLFYTILFVSLVSSLEAQELYSHQSVDAPVGKAADLYYREMYRSSAAKLRTVAPVDANVLLGDDVKFMEAMSALYNEQTDAGALMENIVGATPKNIHYPEIMFGYGRYLYSKNKYKDAADIFKQLDAADIPANDRSEYYFKMGYAQYKSGKQDEALNSFRRIKDQKNKYADAALYYYSHIEYEKGNYITAKQGFERLKIHPNYSSIAPYYTLQIAFIQKDYDKVIAEGEKFLSLSVESRFGEISRLIAEAYLQKGDMQKASEYFARYEKTTGTLERDDHYLKGYIAYKNKDYEGAIKSFTPASGSAKDSLSQLADYHLADCYLQTGSKAEALTAFMKASQAKFNPEIQENAFYNYAKLALEVQNNEAPMANYLEKYPAAINNAELALYRAEAMAKKAKYADALQILQAIPNPTVADKNAMQKLAFAAGTDLYKKEDYAAAIKMFDFALSNSAYSNSASALSAYWKANAIYQLGNYDDALERFRNFVNTAGSFNLVEYNIAHYNIGYCYFKKNNYDQALQWFRKYISFEATSSRKSMYLGDCYNRIGDCYFKKRNYQLAVDNYNTAEALGLSNPDYSALQKAISTGFISGVEAKINALKYIPRSYPNSKLIPSAYYELGRAYQQQMKYEDAVESFISVVTKYPSSPVCSKSLNELGLIEFNRGNSDRALSYYQQVVSKAPNSADAQNALAGIKDIYIDQNRMDEYFAYTSKIGKSVGNASEKDSLVFIGAERLYQSGNYERALPALLKYINEYPNGTSAIAANFYAADCYMKQNDYAQALQGYSYVVKHQDNDFIEAAWSGVARAHYNMKNYGDAAVAFDQLKTMAKTAVGKLDAETGSMRAHSIAGNNRKAMESAKVIAATAGVSDELKREANIIIGREYQADGSHKAAIELFKSLAKDLNQPIDAEAKYRLIISYVAEKMDKQAEEEVFSFSESQSRQQYWVAKSFIVLGEIYVRRNEKVQAEATFKSVIEGYPNQDDGVIEEAQKKLNELQQ